MKGRHKPTVSLVGDDADTRLVALRHPERQGPHCGGFGRSEACRMAVVRRPDRVVLDLSMSIPDGYEVIPVARCREDFARLPAIVVTAYDRAVVRGGADAAASITTWASPSTSKGLRAWWRN